MQKLNIISVHTAADDNLRKYLVRKIERLDKYLPRHDRASAHAEVRLKESPRARNRQQRFTCEVTLHLPHDTLNVTETALNMYAAIDIVETKLRLMIAKHKQLRASPRLHRRLLMRLQRRSAAVPAP